MYTAGTLTDSFTYLQKLRTIYLKCLHDPRVILISSVVTVPIVESPNVLVLARNLGAGLILHQMSLWSEISSKLIRDVMGHKPINSREFVFLFTKPAKCLFYFFLHIPSCPHWINTLLTLNTWFIYKAKSLKFTLLRIMHNNRCSWCSVRSTGYTQYVWRCGIVFRVNKNANHFTTRSFYFT